MFGEGHDDRSVQRGINEAFACQDMLERAPVKASRIIQTVTSALATARSIAHREPDAKPQVSSAALHGTR